MSLEIEDIYAENLKRIFERLACYKSKSASFARRQKRHTWLLMSSGYSFANEQKLIVYVLDKLNIPYVISRRKCGSTVTILDVPQLRDTLEKIDTETFFKQCVKELLRSKLSFNYTMRNTAVMRRTKQNK